MFCPKCGTEISNDALFCYNCGNPISVDQNNAMNTVSNNENPYDFKPVNKVSQPVKNDNKPIVIIGALIFAALVILIVVIVCVFGLKKKDNKVDSTEAVEISEVDTEQVEESKEDIYYYGATVYYHKNFEDLRVYEIDTVKSEKNQSDFNFEEIRKNNLPIYHYSDETYNDNNKTIRDIYYILNGNGYLYIDLYISEKGANETNENLYYEFRDDLLDSISYTGTSNSSDGVFSSDAEYNRYLVDGFIFRLPNDEEIHTKINQDKKIIDNTYIYGKGKETLKRKESNNESSNTISDSSEETNSQPSSNTSVREFLDSYEAFMNKYIAFMEKYQNSNDVVSMMDDYADIMKQYYDYAEKVEKLDTSNMTKEDYEYYIDVTTRINKKLLKIATN